MSTYQPRWIDGKTVGDSKRDAEGRFAAIAEHTGDLPRGFSLIDVGAHTGYFVARAAGELGCRTVAVDGEPAMAQWRGDLEAAGVDLVDHYLAPGEMAALSSAYEGRFDVGLCLSVLHHVQWWETMLEDMLTHCGRLFVEVALPEEQINPRTVEWRREALAKVSDLPGAVEVCRVPGFDDRQLRPTYLVPGAA